MKNVTQEELDWLAEGELDQAERQRLFDRLDQQECGWKKCALALLEQQALKTSLSNIRSSGHDVSVGIANDEPPEKRMLPIDSLPPTKRRLTAKLSRWALMAGLAGLCFVCGYGLSPHDQRFVDDSIANSDVIPHPHQKFRDQLNTNDPEVLLAINNAVHQINVIDRELIALVSVRNNNQDLLLPVIRSEILSRQFADMPGPSLSNIWSSQFTEAGWELKPHREFLSLHLPNGTNQVLPVNLTNCRYVGKPTL